VERSIVREILVRRKNIAYLLRGAGGDQIAVFDGDKRGHFQRHQRGNVVGSAVFRRL